MQVIGQIVSTLLSLLSKEQGKEIVDALFDKIEEMVERSENKIDDTVILPLITKAREILDVPDNDE
jgi:hypothetical protein